MAASSSSSRTQNVEQAFGEIEALPERERPLASPQVYDVFISHRGPDVKETLASQLYGSLQKRRCRAFLDSEEIKGGDSISSTLHNAICSSLVQIAIFSRGYAESQWCLDELLLMLQQTKAFFIPVFYDVEPWELRYIEKGAYAEAFSKCERKGRNLNKLDDWKSALCHASGISGYELSKYGQDLCDTIVSAVVKWIEARRPLHVAKYPVGLDERVKDFETHCRGRVQGNINTVGIFGFGGSGKTTLAKELFNRKRSNYNASCFLNDVREASAKGELHSMQTKLLKDLFREDRQFDNVDEGTTYLRDRLGTDSDLRFIIVLDDIDHHDQLDALSFTDMQSPGNLVIVTTRNERVLTRAGISVLYRMKGLDMHRARELFCWHAFLQPYPDIGYQDLVASFVMFCGGLPLSLKVLGAHVRGSNDRNYWKLELDKVENILPDDIIQRLKISFDSLDKVEKQIFMDIACFFIGKEKDRALRIWKGSGWNAEHALQALRDKSLVEVEVVDDRSLVEVESNPFGLIFIFGMHDHLRDLGRRMAEDLSPRRLWQPHHLRSMESKGFRKNLAETNGRCFHGFRDSSIGCYITYFIGNTNDCADTSTVLLWLELEPQAECKLKRIPSWIPLQKLQGLHVGGTLQLWDPNLQIKGCQKRKPRNYSQVNLELKELKLDRYGPLPNLPKLLGMLNHLESLVVDRIPNWRDVVTEGTSLSESLRKLSNLRKLALTGVSLTGELALSNNTESTHSESSISTCMGSLETIEICDVNLSKLLIMGEICPSLQSLFLWLAKDLIEVDLKRVKTLNYISLSDCYKLRSIAGIEDLEGLKRLHLEGVQGSGVWNCIYGLKRLPSEVTGVICFDAEESSLNADLFFGIIDADSVNEIHCMENKLKMSGSMSAIILCVGFRVSTFRGGGFGHISTPWFGVRIHGEGIVTIVVTDKNKIDRCDMPQSILSLSYGVNVEEGYIVNVREGEEWRTLEIFKRIIEEKYLGLKGIR